MFLSGKTIRGMLRKGDLIIDPMEDGQVQPASVDLRIADEMMVAKGGEITFGKETGYEKKRGEVVIPPKRHAIVRTIERVELPKDVGGITKLRSSASRIGVMFNNAGWVDPGFRGTLSLSVFNSNDVPVRIRPGTRLFQLVLVRLDVESEGYSGKYADQKGITGSRAHMDRDLNIISKKRKG